MPYTFETIAEQPIFTGAVSERVESMCTAMTFPPHVSVERKMPLCTALPTSRTYAVWMCRLSLKSNWTVDSPGLTLTSWSL